MDDECADFADPETPQHALLVFEATTIGWALVLAFLAFLAFLPLFVLAAVAEFAPFMRLN